MNKSSLLYQFIRLILVTAGVYLSLRYLLPIVFPFLLAYILIRMLYPIMNFLHKRLRLPRFLSHYGTLIGFFAAVTGVIFVILWKILTQLRLFFSNFPIYRQLLNAAFCRQTEHFCSCIDYYLNLDSGTALTFCEEQLSNFEENGRELITSRAGQTLVDCISGSFQFFAMLIILVISMLLLVKEIEPIHRSYRSSIYFIPIHSVLIRLKESGLTYLKTESIILLINWLVCSLGLFLIHNPYFFLLGMCIAIFDAFPILGSGFIFIPWGLYAFFNQNYFAAAILITSYLITLFVREYLEAKLLGKGMGLNPFFMIAAIFIGIELFGASGIFLGPLSIVLIQAILSLANEQCDHLQG